jgi:MSHA biogenesis protein MshN
VSLINQVLKNVEARQGGTASDGWAGQQVKPVLAPQVSKSSSWIKRLIFLLVVLGISGWMVLHWSELSAFYQSTQSKAAKSTDVVTNPVNQPTQVLPKAVANATPVVEPQGVENQQSENDHPQLTRSLFSEWQHELSESVTKPAIRGKTSAVSSSKSAVTKADVRPQVEGEFSIQPVEGNSSATIVSAVEPPLEQGAVAKNQNNAEAIAFKGTVDKQMRPEQEANVLIQRAVDHEQKGRMNEALATLRQALATYPQSEDARQLLAAYLFEGKQEQEAIAVLQAGIKRYPEQVGLSKSLAKWQLSHGQPEAALSALKPVANAFAKDAESQWILAMAYQQLGQHQAALPYFEKATALRSGQAQWTVAYAISLQAAGQYAQALQQLQLAQSLPLSERMAEFVSQRIRQLGGTPQVRAE